MTDRPNNRNKLARRQALAALAVGSLAAPLPAARAQARQAPPTPSQTLGPFYPRSAAERPAQTDADLLAVEGGTVLSKGTPLYLTGRVLARDGRPLPGTRVEIWQCDANAVYHHPDGGPASLRDPHFQGYGETRTDESGAFHFRTIRPVPYPGRTPHIHVRVQAGGAGSLSTQLYLPGDPGNERDVLYRRLDTQERSQLALNIKATSASHPLAQATREMAAIDLVLG
jgi:protocatechuate 3,4-dioxygenase beta subunit